MYRSEDSLFKDIVSEKRREVPRWRDPTDIVSLFPLENVRFPGHRSPDVRHTPPESSESRNRGRDFSTVVCRSVKSEPGIINYLPIRPRWISVEPDEAARVAMPRKSDASKGKNLPRR